MDGKEGRKEGRKGSACGILSSGAGDLERLNIRPKRPLDFGGSADAAFAPPRRPNMNISLDSLASGSPPSPSLEGGDSGGGGG